jgi:menaquinone-dependent protoporphyrinogen oxidase
MKLLVAVASKHGSTREIGRAIADVVRHHDIKVTVLSPENINNITGYDGVVIGSAVYAGHWLPEARNFVSNNVMELRKLPVWLFSSGPIGNPLKPDADKAVAIDSILTQLDTSEHRLFGGKIDKSKLGVVEKALVIGLRVPEGDYRNWEEIRSWADNIANELLPLTVEKT